MTSDLFLINAVLTTVGALLISPTYLARANPGDPLGLKTIYAAMIDGLLENLIGAYILMSENDAVPLALSTVVSVFRTERVLGTVMERQA